MSIIKRTITDDEFQRLYEIDFYIFIKYLLNNYDNSVLTVDIIESFCELFKCNTTVIKRLASEIFQGNGIIIPEKLELCVLGYKQNWTFRKIKYNYNMSFQTVYNQLDIYISQGSFSFMPKLDEDEFIVVKKFITKLRELTGWKVL